MVSECKQCVIYMVSRMMGLRGERGGDRGAPQSVIMHGKKVTVPSLLRTTATRWFGM